MSEAYTEQDLREAYKTRTYEDIATLVARIRSEARAGMREACAEALVCHFGISGWLDAPKTVKDAIRSLPDLAADEAIERIHDEAHEVALPLAAEQIIGALTEGGDFAEGSPLAKVMQAIERIKREARLDEHTICCQNKIVMPNRSVLYCSEERPCERRKQLAALNGKEPSA